MKRFILILFLLIPFTAYGAAWVSNGEQDSPIEETVLADTGSLMAGRFSFTAIASCDTPVKLRAELLDPFDDVLISQILWCRDSGFIVFNAPSFFAVNADGMSFRIVTAETSTSIVQASIFFDD